MLLSCAKNHPEALTYSIALIATMLNSIHAYRMSNNLNGIKPQMALIEEMDSERSMGGRAFHSRATRLKKKWRDLFVEQKRTWSLIPEVERVG